jgi:hypothetical protein
MRPGETPPPPCGQVQHFNVVLAPRPWQNFPLTAEFWGMAGPRPLLGVATFMGPNDQVGVDVPADCNLGVVLLDRNRAELGRNPAFRLPSQEPQPIRLPF